MRKVFWVAVAVLLPVAAYVASPFFTAWAIRDAIRTGNADYLAAKIEWDPVRESLRQSLMQIALDGPQVVDAAESESLEAEPQTAEQPKGLWGRLKAAIGKRAVDKMVDAYVTPEGLPQLFSYRKMVRDHVTGDPNAGLSWAERASGFWSRIKRAEFHSLTSFEIEMADRNEPTRRYRGLLELSGYEWKLTRLTVRQLTAEAPSDGPRA